MSDGKVRYAIIGLGEHALRSHALPGKGIAELELVGGYDPFQEAFERFEQGFGDKLTYFPSVVDLLISDIDAVLIMSPDHVHMDNLADSVAMGKHVLVEKPIAINTKGLAMLAVCIKEARNKGLIISSCHPRRYDPPFVDLKNLLGTFIGEYGKVIGFDFDFSYHKPTRSWKSNRRLLLDHANHEIDLVSFLFGYRGFNAQRMIDEVDRYEVVGVRSDKISFSFRGTRLLNGYEYPEFIKIRFERGHVYLDAKEGQLIEVNHETGETEVTYLKSGTDYAERFYRLMVNFTNSVLGREANYLKYEDLWINSSFGVELNPYGLIHKSDFANIGFV